MVILNNVPLPLGDPIAEQKRTDKYKANEVDPQAGFLTQPWIDFMTGQQQRIDQSPVRVSSVSVPTMSASVGLTDITNGTLSAGLYRLSYFLHVTVGDFGASVAVTLDWKTEGVTLSFAPDPVPTDDDTQYQSGAPGFSTDIGPGLIYIDALSPVRYGIVYTPLGGGAQWSFRIVLEQVQA